MIINEELMASMDEPTECMVMHRTEPSRLQSLSLQLADKLAQLVENNERLLELRPGGKIFFFFSFEKQLFFARMFDYLIRSKDLKRLVTPILKAHSCIS